MNQRKIPPLLRHFAWSRWSLWNVESRRFLDAPNKTVPSPSSGSVEMTLDVMAHERRCSLFCRANMPTFLSHTRSVHNNGPHDEAISELDSQRPVLCPARRKFTARIRESWSLCHAKSKSEILWGPRLLASYALFLSMRLTSRPSIIPRGHDFACCHPLKAGFLPSCCCFRDVFPTFIADLEI